MISGIESPKSKLTKLIIDSLLQEVSDKMDAQGTMVCQI